MFGMISNYKNLYVADFSKDNDVAVRIVFSHNTNFVVDGKIIYPFATDVVTGADVLVTNSNHVKKLKYYVNCFGFPRKHVFGIDKKRQKLVVSEMKKIKKIKNI